MGTWRAVMNETSQSRKLRHPATLFLGRHFRQWQKHPAGGLYFFSLQKPLRRIKKAMAKALDHKRLEFRFHDLRRTAASHMTAIGIQRLVVSKVLNHVEQGITKVYDRHSYDTQKRAALLKWDRRITEIATGRAEAKVVEFPARA